MVFRQFSGKTGNCNEKLIPIQISDSVDKITVSNISTSYALIRKITTSLKNVTFENDELKFNWEVNEGDIWHYNIYEVKENQEAEYRNMIGEAFETNFTYKPTYSGKRYYVIQPESNQGVYGKALKVEVNL